MILTDSIVFISDQSLTELHREAKNVGARQFFHPRNSFPRYIVDTPAQFGELTKLGAKFVSSYYLGEAGKKFKKLLKQHAEAEAKIGETCEAMF